MTVFVAIFSSVFLLFKQQNRSSEGFACIAGFHLITFFIFLIQAVTLVVCPMGGVGPCLHGTVGVHQNGLGRQCAKYISNAPNIYVTGLHLTTNLDSSDNKMVINETSHNLCFHYCRNFCKRLIHKSHI